MNGTFRVRAIVVSNIKNNYFIIYLVSLLNSNILLSMPRWGWFYDFFDTYEIVTSKLTFIISALSTSTQIQTTLLLGLNRLIAVVKFKSTGTVRESLTYITIFFNITVMLLSL